jgi:hypothetical protein
LTKEAEKCIQNEVSRAFFSMLCGLVALGAISWLRADTPPPKAQPGYKLVPIKQGGHTAYIQVQDQTNPFQNVKGTDDTAGHIGFNSTSSMANQKYDLGEIASAHDQGRYQQNLENTFITKSYFADNGGPKTVLPDQVPVNAAAGYAKTASGFDKSFLTASSDVGQNKTAPETDQTSSYQGHTAELGGHEIKKFASTMNGKPYRGVEAAVVKRELAQMNEGMLGLKDLPDRTLTVDEVRALINHGVKPDTDTKPSEPTKALNDPDYLPDPAPAPLRSTPADARHLRDSNDNDDDIIPPPGMMAHGRTQGSPPENSEPLPK